MKSLDPHHASALADFRRASRALAQRVRGERVATMPDWLAPGEVISLQVALPGDGSGAPQLTVTIADGIPATALPPFAWGNQAGAPLVVARAPRARAQLAPEMRAALTPSLRGTATALAADVLSPRQFVLTCGHVAAGLPGAAVNDRVDISVGGNMHAGRLVDWQPSLGVGVLRTGLDAALVEVTAADALDLRNITDWLPAGVNTHPVVNLPVSVRRSAAPIPGLLKVYWSGLVDVPGYTPGVADYFLEGGIGYLATSPTSGGDSGAAVWDDRDRLMGMHVGELPNAQGGLPNAVYAPIQPALDWYSVRLQTRGGMGHPAAAPAAGPANPVPALSVSSSSGGRSFPASDREVVACTLWGEARNQGPDGLRAVASVIENRRKAGYRRKHTAADVCLDPWQFSCWNSNDVNLGRMRAVAASPDAQYRDALDIADQVLRQALPDSVRQARHYYASSLRKPPFWAKGKSPCIVVGDHLFFNDID